MVKIKKADSIGVQWDHEGIYRWTDAAKADSIAMCDHPILDELESLDDRFTLKTTDYQGESGACKETFGQILVEFLGVAIVLRKWRCQFRLSTLPRSKLKLKKTFDERAQLSGASLKRFTELCNDDDTLKAGRLPSQKNAGPKELEYMELYRLQTEIPAKVIKAWLIEQADLLEKDRSKFEELSKLSHEELVRRAMGGKSA